MLCGFLTLTSLSMPMLDAQAAMSPLSLAVVPPVQFPPDDYTITGARVSVLWGRHRDIYGLDIGLLGNITEQAFVGLGIAGGFNMTKGNTTVIGLQAAGGANVNYNKTHISGIQFALVANYNEAASSVAGIQLAAVNQAAFTDIYGFQIGVYNRSQSVYGLQIGVVNVTNNLHGVQIGLVNFNHSGPFKVSPILNVGF